MLAAAAVAQRQDDQPQQEDDQPQPNGTIYGVAIGQDGQPARGISLRIIHLFAEKFGDPQTRTNENGEYRFENLLHWGRYTVTAEDGKAGYSTTSSGYARTDPPEVEIAPEHPEAKLTVYLPPKAGFVELHVTNRRTGADIRTWEVAIMPVEKPDYVLVRVINSPNYPVVLVPPDKALLLQLTSNGVRQWKKSKGVLLHVTADGFRERDESVGTGKLIHLASGERLTLDVQLDPAD
jgi:hypothetical protein